jgi:hypothetical protein
MRCVGDAPAYGAAARTEWDIRREELVNEHISPVTVAAGPTFGSKLR